MTESNNTSLAIAPEQKGALEVREQVNAIQYLMHDVLQEGTHYGTIKGCGPKPTLLQAGAEKIAYMFHFVPTYTVEREDFEGGHRSYDVTCTLTNRDTGQVMGYGMGECSTLESKYRYRWAGYGDSRHKEENPDIADTWNTVKKMAKKRAFVDAVKSTTAASDIFTQDIEDMPASSFSAPIPVQAPVQEAPATNHTYGPQMPQAQEIPQDVKDFMRAMSREYSKICNISPNEAAHAILDSCGPVEATERYMQTVQDFVMVAGQNAAPDPTLDDLGLYDSDVEWEDA